MKRRQWAKMRSCILVIFLLLASPAMGGELNALGFKEAAATYGVSAAVLEAISWVESKQNASIAPTRNERVANDGTLRVSHDHGHMQINDHFWKERLNKIDPRLWEAMLDDPKICTEIGAWILSQTIKRYGNTWDAIAAYNTGRAIDLEDCLKATPSYRRGGPITQEDYADAQARVERGRAYALKVYRYLVRNGHITPNRQVLGQLQASRVTKPTPRALPMRKTINVANYRKAGKWRLVE